MKITIAARDLGSTEIAARVAGRNREATLPTGCKSNLTLGKALSRRFGLAVPLAVL
jgi:hypothetical protein